MLTVTLEGGLGLLVGWGADANLVVSAGGFHPQFSPPPLPFPEPPRIAANLLNERYAKVRLEAYFAVTTSAVMFGARAELMFGTGSFRVDGFLSLDVLFQFDPFYFSFALALRLAQQGVLAMLHVHLVYFAARMAWAGV